MSFCTFVHSFFIHLHAVSFCPFARPFFLRSFTCCFLLSFCTSILSSFIYMLFPFVLLHVHSFFIHLHAVSFCPFARPFFLRSFTCCFLSSFCTFVHSSFLQLYKSLCIELVLTLLWFSVLCFVMGYMLQFGEVAHKSIMIIIFETVETVAFKKHVLILCSLL